VKVDKGAPLAEVAGLVRRCLEEGFPVEIDGLGRFRMDAGGSVKFQPEVRPKVFIAYVEEDLCFAKKLYGTLEDHGFDPWLDKKKLLPGRTGRGRSSARSRFQISSSLCFRCADWERGATFTPSCDTRWTAPPACHWATST